jgi:hypothetical protein
VTRSERICVVIYARRRPLRQPSRILHRRKAWRAASAAPSPSSSRKRALPAVRGKFHRRTRATRIDPARATHMSVQPDATEH